MDGELSGRGGVEAGCEQRRRSHDVRDDVADQRVQRRLMETELEPLDVVLHGPGAQAKR